MAWALVEVRGGVAEIDSSGCTTLLVDWDNIANDMGDAENTLDALADAWTGLPPGDFTRIRDTIIEVWPELEERWEHHRSQWTPGLQKREASL